MPQIPPETKEDRAIEAAAIRRRWITLGEILAVLAVLISGVTLYLNWTDKQAERADKAAQNTKASSRAVALVLNATAARDDRLLLKPVDEGQVVQSQTIRFPAALDVDPVETTGDPRIEADWFATGLKRARDKAGLPDDSRGDERLPVAISTRFLANGEAHEDIALYDIGYSIKGRLLGGHDVTLRGLSLVKRVKGNPQAQLDARWGE